MFWEKFLILKKSEFFKKNAYKIYAASAGLTLLIIISVVMSASFGAIARIDEAVQARRQTFLLIDKANNLMSDLVDAETGQRGFLLTNDEAFLSPYHKARENIGTGLKELGQLTMVGEAYSHIDAVTPMIKNKLEFLEYNIELRRHNSVDIAIANIQSSKGILLMDSIRTEMIHYLKIEKNELDEDENIFRSEMSSLFATILTGSLFAILLVLAIAYLIYRETNNRIKKMVHKETQQLLEVQNDINKQLKQTNNALQISEEKLIVTLISIGDGVMATDVEGNVTILNPCAEELTGWTQAEASGRPAEEVFRIINEETRQPVDLPVKAALTLGTKQQLINHTILISRNGSECAIADSCAPICHHDGKVAGSVMVFRDVTERRETEIGLEKTRKELEIIKKTADDSIEYSESIINTVRESLIVLDQDLRVVSVSRSFYEFFKVNPEDTVGQLIYDLGNKQWNIPKLRELLETILPQKTKFDNYEVEHDFATIGRRIMLLNARQIERGTGLEKIILLAIEDITQRKEIEAGLENANKELNELATELKRVAHVKSEFLANMSHELRTPLNSINGFSEVLSDETFGALNEKQKKYVNNVLISGKHLLLLINQILDMAKVEAGKMKLALSVLPTKSVLNEISMLVADMVSKKKLQMITDIADDLPDIEADELKVKEIIYNLLSNAVKFTPEGGQISMKANKIDPEIEIEVWDSGVGIAQENIEKIFEGFFRVDTPYSRVTEGTGLGLPLSKKLVELHGGKFSIESEGLNKGTKVRFTLPIVSPEDAV